MDPKTLNKDSRAFKPKSRQPAAFVLQQIEQPQADLGQTAPPAEELATPAPTKKTLSLSTRTFKPKSSYTPFVPKFAAPPMAAPAVEGSEFQHPQECGGSAFDPPAFPPNEQLQPEVALTPSPFEEPKATPKTKLKLGGVFIPKQKAAPEPKPEALNEKYKGKTVFSIEDFRKFKDFSTVPPKG